MKNKDVMKELNPLKKPIAGMVRSAIDYFKRVEFSFGNKERNAFFMKLKSPVDYILKEELTRISVKLQYADMEDLRSDVYIDLLSYWIPFLYKKKGAFATHDEIAVSLGARLRMLTLLFIERTAKRDDASLYLEAYESDLTGVERSDLRMDIAVIETEIHRRIRSYLSFRGDAKEAVRLVVEKMMRRLVWKQYKDTGEVSGTI